MITGGTDCKIRYWDLNRASDSYTICGLQKEHKPTGIEEVLEQVSHLFADHTDLLMEFTYFLPDYVQEQAKEQLEQYRQQVQESHDRRMRQQQQQGQG